MKTILVPVDYSKAARHAFAFGLQLAQKLDLDLVLLHAFHQPLGVENAYRLEVTIQALEKEQKEVLKQWAHEVQNDLDQGFCREFNRTNSSNLENQSTLNLTPSGNHTVEIPAKVKNQVKIKYDCQFGLATEGIIQAAQTYKADLILISSRGAGMVGQTLLGSTVAWVTAYSPVPVLTLPPHGLFKLPQSIVFAADLHQLSLNTNFYLLRTLVKTLKTDLKVLHIYQDENLPEEQQKAQKGFETLDVGLKDVSYKVYLRHNKQIESGIQDFIQQHQADLLVLIPGRHSLLELLFNHSTMAKFIQNGSIPFLTLPLRSPENNYQSKVQQEQKAQS